MLPNFRKSAVFALTSVLAASTILSASAASTTKTLSSNFTLVNLVEGENNGQIAYIKPDGSPWRASESITELDALGDQIIRRQYDPDSGLTAGSGSVVVSTDGPVGAVVQIQARNQTPSSGAYIGVSEGAPSANVPLVQRRRTTASGIANSQIIIQNASGIDITPQVVLINGTDGSTTFTKNIPTIKPNASFEYDLEEETNLPEEWFGSAIVNAVTPGGEVAVVSNLFNGGNTLQTFNAFTESKTKWGVPLFAARLDNELNAPIAVQNVGNASIPVGAVTLSCTKDPASTASEGTLTRTNTAAIGPNASFFFNPVNNADFPKNWFGACTVDSGAFQTAVFVQLRKVLNSLDPTPGITPDVNQRDRAGAHEGIPLDSTDQRVVIPLYAKRLANSFASAVTILNLSTTSVANVTLDYKPSKELIAANPGFAATCNVNFTRQIPAGGSLIQNHRLPTGTGNDNPNSVPQLPTGCYGALTVTSSDQPIDAFTQLDLLDELLPNPALGDPFQAHNNFTVPVTN